MPPKEKVEHKIGQKLSVDTKKKEERIVNNGHKSFLAHEAKAISETLARENATRNMFEAKRKHLIMPRNPLTGDATPREIAPGKWNQATLILALDDYNPDAEYPKLQVKPVGEPNKEIANKVGYIERKYEPGSTALPLDYKMSKIQSLKNLQDNLSIKIDMFQQSMSEREQEIRKSIIRNRMTGANYTLRPGQV